MKNKLLLCMLLTMHCATLLYASPNGSISSISRVYGNRFSPEVSQNPQQGELGTLNLGFGTGGNLNVSAQLALSQAKAIRIASNGIIFVALNSRSATVIAAYNAAGTLDTSFGASGICTLSGSNLFPKFMQIDSQGNILVGGVDGWMQRISSVGVIDTGFATQFNATVGTWNFIGNIAEQSTGNLIITGLKDGFTQVARILPSGALDTTFGTDGYIIFNGTPSLLNSTTGAYSVVITNDDSIFVGFADTEFTHASIAKFVVNGALATGFGQGGIRTNVVGASTVLDDSIGLALDWNGNVIAGATIVNDDTTNSVELIAFNASTGDYADGISPISVPASGSNSVQFASMITLSNGSIVVMSTDITNFKMRIDQFNPDGTRDTNFNAITTANPNGTPGYLEISIIPDSGTILNSYLTGGAIAPNGQLFVAGCQVTASPTTIIPYISQIYEYEYVSQVPQYQTSVQQGTINQNFGGSATLTYPGIVSPYLGSYRGNLQQHPMSVLEVNYGTVPAVGDIVVGMYGATNISSTQSMMLNWLYPYGMLDTAVGFNNSGQLILTQATTGVNEFLYALAQDASGALYVAGKVSGTGAIIRKYTDLSTSTNVDPLENPWTVGTAAWANSDSASSSSSSGVGIALQGASLVVMFEDCGNGTGAISAYDPATGHIANGVPYLTFGNDGTGTILTTAYTGMHMGPVYGGVINDGGQIFVAYKNTTTGYVDIAAFNKDGSGLVSTFGASGIAVNILRLTSTVSDASSVRLAFDAFGNLLVSTVDQAGLHVLLGRVNQVSGTLDASFGVNGIASIPLLTPTVTQLQGVTDGSTVITGSLNADQMFVARVTSQGVLDTTFNSQGVQPGVSIIAIETNPFAASATGVAVKSTGSKGDLVVVGSQDLYSSDATPMVVSLFGTPGTTAVRNYPLTDQDLGTLDTSFNGTGGFDLTEFMISGIAEFMYAYPSGSVYEGMILIGINNPGFNAKIIRFNTVTLELDPTFTIYTAVSYVTAMTVDSENRIIIAGTHANTTWAQRLTADGLPDLAFAIPIAPAFNSITQIAQQQSGRYIFSGNIEDVGYGLVAYQNELVDSNSRLQLDATFNPMGTYPGMYPFTGYPVYSVVINQDDTILAAWMNDSPNLYIAKIYANASGMVQDFGSDGIANTHIHPSDETTIRIALDSLGNIIAGASVLINEISDYIDVVRYLPTGYIDNTWNPSGGVGQITTLSGFGHSVTLTSILESTSQQTVLLGYNTITRINGIHGPLFAVSLTRSGILDETWNPHADPADVPGILTYTVESSTSMGTGAFAVNGNIFAVGGTGDGHPLIMELVASGISATQEPLATAAGLIDSTINTQGTGYDALNLNTQLSLTLGAPQQLHIMNDSNGAMIMTSFLGSTAYITKINADLSLDTNFNPFGISSSSPGYIAKISVSSIADLFVADAMGNNGNIYVTGNSAGPAIWAQVISADGSSQATLTAINSLTQATAIRQGSGNVLIAGYAGATGIIAAFNSDLSALDRDFGVEGYYTTAVNNPIGAMTLDNQARIYIAYKIPGDSYTLSIQRIFANGSGIDGAFNVTVNPISCNEYQIKLALDQANNQLIVADYHDSGITISRYSTIDGTLTGSQFLTMYNASLQLSDLFVDTDQNIYVIAYDNNSPYQVVVARYNGSASSTEINIDASYGVAGIASVPITPISSAGYSIGAGILHPDGRVYVAGASSGTIPYMSRFFGDNYYTEVSQSFPISLTPGDFDTTYGNGTGYVVNYAGGATLPTANQQVKAIHHLNSTNLMTIVNDGTQSWTLRLLQNGTNDPSYGNGNGIEITQLEGDESVATMIVGGAGQYLVIGNNDLQATGYLKKINPNGSMDGTFGGFTGQASTALYPVGTVYGLLSHPAALAQLTNGNIVVVGENAGVGTIQMVESTGVVSTTFGTLGQVISGDSITSISADSSNNLYVTVGYISGSDKVVRVMKLDQNGSILWTVDNVLIGIKDYASIHLALDVAGNIIVGATAATLAGELICTRLLPNGTIDHDFNDGNLVTIDLANVETAVAHITDIVPLANRIILISGYQLDVDSPTNNQEFVVALNTNGALETSFNEFTLNGPTPGIASFKISPSLQLARMLYNMDIQSNGQVILGGAESPDVEQSTPLTIRLIGYQYVQAVQQYPGDAPVTPNVLNPLFNGTGIATTGTAIHELLVGGGNVVIDSFGNVIIAGVTSSNIFVICRFLPNGTLDHTYGISGVGTSGAVDGLLAACSIAIDAANNVFVGGITTTTNQFVVVKFDANGNLDTSYGTDGTPGISLTNPNLEASLVSGGHIAIGSFGEIIIAGYVSSEQFAINQLNGSGQIITTYLSDAITSLISGGFVVVDRIGNLFISGATSAHDLVIIKYTYDSDLFTRDDAFGNFGIARAPITDLVDGGSIALDSLDNIVIGGYTSDETFAVARFLPTGLLDSLFNNGMGIAYSQPIVNLLGVGSIGVGSLNDIIIGGYARDTMILNSMVVAVFTTQGAVNTQFSATGTGSTGPIDFISRIPGLSGGVIGGFVAINKVGQILLGGWQHPSISSVITKLVIAEMYSGYEILIDDLAALNSEQRKTYYYGNNRSFLHAVLNIELFSHVILNEVTRQNVVTRVTANIDAFIASYINVSGFNLVWNLFLDIPSLQALELILLADHENSTVEIGVFFDKLLLRIRSMQFLEA